ncbi:MAG: radical SAM protein [Planctomycetota bacterium]
MNTYPDHRTLYRLPWSLPDNPIAWLEPTSACNIYCEGCYRANTTDGHKPLDQVREELEVFRRYRNFDGVSIAGGDPLVHPEIVRIAAMVTEMGHKPIVNTNGVALTDDLLRELHRVGVRGFTFHIDSKQFRPGWQGKNEVELNDLRLEFAERLARVGGISCAFNSTVYQDTLPYAPDIVEWAQRHIDKVHVVVFIAYRQASGDVTDNMDFYVGDRKISMDDLVYSRPTGDLKLDISSRDVVAEIRKRFPDFAPCAYLNGSEQADSLKWLLTTRMGTRSRIYGYVGPRFAELAQIYHHFRHGRFMAYAPPSLLRKGKMAATVTSPFDAGARRILGRGLRRWLTRPWRLFRRLHIQSVMIIQPVDILADGRMDMCDACPDLTVHEGELVWSCRLEERIKYGGFARGVPKQAVRPAAPEAAPATAEGEMLQEVPGEPSRPAER